MKITDPGLRERIAEAMADPDTPRLLHSMRTSPKNAQSISTETDIPLSSIYRKIGLLRAAGLVLVKSIEITREGKRQDLYQAAVTEVRMNFSGPAVEVELVPTDEGANRLWFKMFSEAGR